MKTAVQTGLKAHGAPFEWAVTADNILYTAQIPMRADGTIETGDVASQTRLILNNLQQTLSAAGGTLNDVTQVLIYITNGADFPIINDIYRQYFSEPHPNRATVIVASLLVPGMVIEIVAYAHLPHAS
jgi:2-iminobutanoate/2-iminopropanoate deaminase